jgi:predicted membrane-bound spermidine synthase
VEKRRSDPIFALFFVSGFSGLIYESVWSHYVKLFLGHAAYAQTLVLVVFIGGLALGAWLCARRAQSVRNPLRAYAIVEAAIGIMALVFHTVFNAAVDWGYSALLPAACEQATTFCAPQWLLAAALLAPQSILLGATFPLVCSAVLRLDAEQPGHDIAALYFLNSLGAVLGVLASAFVLIPSVGLPGTLMTAGFANLLLATAAYFLSRTPPRALDVAPAPRSSPLDSDSKGLVRLLLATAFLTGLSSFIYEVVWIRMLSLVLGASTHSFEIMLASFILGLALGGFWVRRRVDDSDPIRFLAYVQMVMGIAALATIPIYNGAFDFIAWVLYAASRNDGGFVIFNLSSTTVALLVMLPATFCAGMTLPLITYRLLRSPTGERALGMVYAVNTLGSIIGVVIAFHLLLEWLGLRGALIVGAVIDVGLGIVLLARSQSAPGVRRFGVQAVAAVAVLALLAGFFKIDPRRSASGVFRSGAASLPANHQVIYHRDGKTATVDVLDNQSVRSIRTNGKSDAGMGMGPGAKPSNDEYTMVLLALLPLGHRIDARNAAVIGFGSGMSTAMLLASKTLERVDTIEIEPAMVDGARHFRPVVDAAFNDPRSHIVIDDAKSYFARGRNRYDIIVSEPSNPWVSGVASLFTEEFYARLATYLNEGGVLSQWLHTYEMDAPTLASIIAAVSKTFPDFVIYSSIDSDIVLIARKGGAPGTFDARALALPDLQPILQKLQLTDVELVKRRSMVNSQIAMPFLRTYRVPANSDFFPVVDQRASKTRFTQARVNELTELQASALPLLEMLGAAPAPSGDRHAGAATTYLDQSILQAWTLRDIVMRQPTAFGGHSTELAALAVSQWAASCPAGWTFEHMLPSFIEVAELVNARLSAQAASEVWKRISQSPCARSLPANERSWLDLFDAIGRRDAGRMAALGSSILEAIPSHRGSVSELPFFAAVTGLLCTSQADKARNLLEVGASRWVRRGVRVSELRLLDALTTQPPARCPGAS